MIGKSRYHLQLKLQAALSRVVQVLARFQAEGLHPNYKNIVLAGGLIASISASQHANQVSRAG
jgi:hypothetical protein